MKLEEKLVALRKEKGLTQLQLAEMLNVSRQAVSRWEGGLAVPSLENLKYLGNLYNVPLDYLLSDNEEVCNINKHPREHLEDKESTGFSKAGRKILCKHFSTKSRMALESRADSGLNPLITESHGGQNGMRAGTA